MLVWFLFIGNYLYTNFQLLNILLFAIAAEHLTDVISSSQQCGNKHMPSFPRKGILIYLCMSGIRWSGFVLTKAHFSFALNSYLTLKPEFTHHSSHHRRDFT